jgi:hypothetical protein
MQRPRGLREMPLELGIVGMGNYEHVVEDELGTTKG